MDRVVQVFQWTGHLDVSMNWLLGVFQSLDEMDGLECFNGLSGWGSCNELTGKGRFNVWDEMILWFF